MKVYVARDSDGTVWMYTSKPQLCINMWAGENCSTVPALWVKAKAKEGDSTARAILSLSPWDEPLEINLTIETKLNF